MSARTSFCALAGRCGGCPWLASHDAASERAAKIDALRKALAWEGPVALTDVDPAGMRDKLDLQLRDGVIGLVELSHDDGPRALVDMLACPLATAPVNALLAELRADRPPVARASVRLRASVDGAVGMWLDLSHSDVKLLLDERAWLTRWLERHPDGELELGPKARRVRLEGGSDVVLEPARLRPWSSTWRDLGDDARAHEVSLSSRVADFTQPSRRANRALVKAVMGAVQATANGLGADRWLELGAGAGNLTLPLIFDRRHVRAVELDATNLRANLAASAPDAAASGLVVELSSASFARAADVATLVRGVDAVLADPPRSGLGPFATALAGLAPSLRPRDIVYVSCHVDALARDAIALTAAGYAVQSVAGVDQFPHGPQAEWVVRFGR